MKLWEAMKLAMEKGKKVKIDIWCEESYIRYDSLFGWHEKALIGDEERIDNPMFNNKFSNNWEIYKEPLIPAQEIPDMPIYCPNDYVIINNKKYVYAK
jgi:hypothetical protein